MTTILTLQIIRYTKHYILTAVTEIQLKFILIHFTTFTTSKTSILNSFFQK